jgi:hypothetical protein
MTLVTGPARRAWYFAFRPTKSREVTWPFPSHSGVGSWLWRSVPLDSSFQLSHSALQGKFTIWFLRIAGLASGRLLSQSRQAGFAIPHQLETRQAIDLFRRTWLAGISIGIDVLTFA